MKDRFKFRVYDTKEKVMHNTDFVITSTGYAAKIYYIFNNVCHFNQTNLELDKNCIVMQSTGLKDKNGKLIFEGDIVKRFHLSSTMQPSIFIGVVSYDNKKGRWEIKNNEKSDWFYEDDLFEVLENIYENPTLLIS